MLPLLLLLACEDRDRDTGVTQHWVVWDDTGPGDTDTHGADSGDSGETDAVVDTDDTGDTGEPCPPDTETVLRLCNAESTYLGRPGEYASTAHVGDFDGDGQLGLAISAPSSSYGTGYEEGLVYVVNDPTPGTTELSNVGDLVYGSGTGSKLQVTATLDADYDGTADLALYEWLSDEMETEVYLLNGPLVGLRSVTQAELVVSGDQNSLLLPEGASGDLDADGSSELLLRTFAYGRERTGAMLAFPADWTGSLVEEDAAWVVTWSGDPSEGEYTGAVVADMTGDGVDDLVLGTPKENGWLGAVRVFEGPVVGSLTEVDAVATRSGSETDVWVGYDNLACDFNGDGQLDLAVGVPSGGPVAEASGAIWIALGPLAGEDALANAEIGIFGRSEHELLGGPLASGDQDGDGKCELAAHGYASDSDQLTLVWRQLSIGKWYDATATLAIVGTPEDGFSIDDYAPATRPSPGNVIAGWSRRLGAESGTSVLSMPWSDR